MIIGRSSQPVRIAASICLLIMFVLVLIHWVGGMYRLADDEANVGYWAGVVLSGKIHSYPHGAHYFHIFGRPVPLAWTFYKGPWIFYTAVPFVWAFPSPLDAMKFHSYFWVIMSVLSTFWLAYAMCGKLLIALLCALGLATTHQFIITAMSSGTVIGGLPSVLLSTLALACLSRAVQGSRLFWFLSCLLAGLSVGFDPQGLAVLVGWLFSVLWLRQELSYLKERWTWVFSALLLCIGSAPLFAAYCMFGGFIGEFYSALISKNGIHNLDYVGNLGIRWEQLSDLLRARGYGSFGILTLDRLGRGFLCFSFYT